MSTVAWLVLEMRRDGEPWFYRSPVWALNDASRRLEAKALANEQRQIKARQGYEFHSLRTVTSNGAPLAAN